MDSRGGGNAGAAVHRTTETRPSPFQPPLYQQRAQLIYKVLRAHRCTSFLDAGCSEGTLLAFLLASQLQLHGFTYAMAIDRDETALHSAHAALPHESNCPTAPLHTTSVDFVCGDLTSLPTTCPPLLQLTDTQRDSYGVQTNTNDCIRRSSVGKEVDAVLCVEVIEHIAPHDVAAFTDVLFAQLGAQCTHARLLILTTPNRAANARFDNIYEEGSTSNIAGHKDERRKASEMLYELPAERSIYSTKLQQPRRRHDEHYFELTPAQFVRYCDYVIKYFALYWSHYELIGVGDNFTQGAVFYSAATTPSPRCQNEANECNKTKREDVSWHFSRHERRTNFPFADVFGMSWTDYCDEFGVHNALTTSEADKTAACSTSQYVCLLQDCLQGHSLWGRLCDTVHDEVMRAVEALNTRTFSQQGRNPRQVFSERMNTSLHRTRDSAIATVRSAASIQAFLARHRSSSALSKYSTPTHTCKGTRCMGCVSFAQLMPLPTTEPPQSHWRNVYYCTLAALTSAMREQRAAWHASYVEALHAWCAYVKHTPSKFALHPYDIFRSEHSNNTIDGADDATQWRQQSVSQLVTSLLSRSTTCIVRHNSRAAAVIVSATHTSNKNVRGIELLHAVQLAQCGLRVYDWLLTYWHKYTQDTATGCTRSDSCIEDDETRCSDVFSPIVWRLLFFMAAVDVLPGAGQWLRQRLPRLWPRHVDITSNGEYVKGEYKSIHCVPSARRKLTCNGITGNDALARVAEELYLWPCCPYRLAEHSKV